MPIALLSATLMITAIASSEVHGESRYDYPRITDAQGLDTFMQRRGVKPYDLFERDGALLTRRLIFTDREHGTPVWMLGDAPTAELANTASIWPLWNADGTSLFLPGARELNGERHRGWLIDRDFARLTPAPPGGQRRPIRDREDPDIYFVRRDGQLLEINQRTGEQRTVAEWEPYHRERIYGLTRDNRYAFLETPNGGIWLPYDPGDEPIAPLPMYDGRPVGLDDDGNPVHPRDASDELMYRGSPRGIAAAEHDEHGHMILVRTGKLIDRKTGEIDHVIAPLSGQDAYLRTFISDRVQWPEGQAWDKYRIHRSDDLDEMFEIYRYYPMLTHGHEGHSPDGRYIAKDRTPLQLTRIRDGHTERFLFDPDGGHYHLHWLKHPRFFVGWVRGWRYGNYRRVRDGDTVYQFFTDLTAQPIFRTYNRKSTHYGGDDFSMQSPDATKVHTASPMTGRFRHYIAVMARPRPPRHLRWEAEGDAVNLTWRPAEYSRETRGYLIYRSDRSGDGYELLTPEPIDQLTWHDETVEPGEAYYYVVTALEHSGLESGYSAEAARAGIDLPDAIDEPLVVYAEAEAAIRDLYTDVRPGLAQGVDRRHASDWYYVYRHPRADRGKAALAVHVPAAGDYTL